MTVTIPPTWTQPAGCLATDDLYGYRNPKGNFADILGAPAETDSCYPSGFQATTPSIMYATGCPDGFTSAGTDAVDIALTVCCPSAYDFSSLPTSFNDYTMFCGSTWTAETTITFTWLSFLDAGTSTATEYTVTSSGTAGTAVATTSVALATEQRLTDRKLNAMGILISTTSIDPASSLSTPTTQPTSTAEPSAAQSSAAATGSGLSAGAAAGIGIACTIAVLLLGAGFWLMYRRGLERGRRAQPDEKDATPAGELDTTDAAYPRHPGDDHNTPVPVRHEAWAPWNLELEGRSLPSEMEHVDTRVELP